MRNKYLSGFFIFAALILMLGFMNCSRPVTFQQSVDLLKSGDIIVGNPMASKSLLVKMCSLVSSCHPEVSVSDCQSGVMKTAGIETQFGVPKGSVTLYSEIVSAEADGSLRANVSAMNSCGSEIEKLSCSNPLVDGAYNPKASNPYSGIAFMIPTTTGSCSAVFTQPPARTDYYVSTTGSDLNDGSATKPWATINHAAQSLVLGSQGATVHVAAGTYRPYTTADCSTNLAYPYSCGIQTTKSGTATAPIVYVSDQLWGAKIIPADAYAAWYNRGDYVTISGFEIIGNSATNMGIQSDGSFVNVESNKIHDIPATLACSRSVGGGAVIHTNVLAHDNNTVANIIHDVGLFPGNGLAPSNYCNHAHGVFYYNPRGHIHNNIMYRIGSWGFVSWANASNFQITNNLIFNSGTRDSTGHLMGGAIALAESTGVHDYTTVSNNILRNNSGTALNDAGVTGTHNVFLNNVLYANGANTGFKPGMTDVGSILADPKMVNFMMDGTGDYRLQNAQSPAVNAGTTTCATGTNCTPDKDYLGFLRPYGAGIDVGPYEWHP